MSAKMPRAVICLHGGNRYALPLSAVRRVTEVTFISRVPRAPPALLGVMNQQGREDLAQIILSLDEIVHATQAGSERVTAISHAAKEQLAGSEEMVKAIREIREVASGNAKSTDEVSRAIREQAITTAQIASASQELTNLSVELQSVVSRFKLE